MQDQAEKLRQLSSQILRTENYADIDGQARVIAVTSGKGGVGKTNITVNLALALINMGKRVLIIDADIGLANIDVLLGVVPQYDLSAVFQGEKKITEVVSEGPGGIKFIAGGTVDGFLGLKDWQLENIISSFVELEEFFDIILIDTGAGVSQNVLSFVLAVNEVLVITTPEPTSIADAYGIIKVISGRNTSARTRLLVNRADRESDAIATSKRLQMVAKKFLNIDLDYIGKVARDDCVVESVMKHKPILMTYPNSQTSKDIVKLAGVIAGTQQEKTDSGGLIGLFRRMSKILKN